MAMRWDIMYPLFRVSFRLSGINGLFGHSLITSKTALNAASVSIAFGLFQQYIHPYYHWGNTQPAPPKPLVHTVHDGQCFEENSLCDVGHDEQCCGHASYCVDYWGVGKCLAYKQPDIYDKLLPVRMHRNNLYKAYMRKMQYLAAAGK